MTPTTQRKYWTAATELLVPQVGDMIVTELADGSHTFALVTAGSVYEGETYNVIIDIIAETNFTNFVETNFIWISPDCHDDETSTP